MKINRTTTIFIVSILVTILVICAFFFFWKIIENKNEHATVVFTTLKDKMKEKENEKLFAEKLAEIKSLGDSIGNYFVDPNKIDTFVGYLEKIGSSVGSDVSVKSIEASKKSENTISFELSIVGTFEQVTRAIVLLENIPYQVNITEVYLNKEIKQSTPSATDTKKSTKTSTWQADVSFNILSTS